MRHTHSIDTPLWSVASTRPLEAPVRRVAGQHLVGAIDAGSNAIRAAVGSVTAPGRYQLVAKRRFAVRLGHRVFTESKLPPETIAEAIAAFAGFRKMFDAYGIDRYRAVGTSAIREATNDDELLTAVHAIAGIDLTPITGQHEARLVRRAVGHAFPTNMGPRAIADLGGGSFEITFLDEGGAVERSAVLRLGTVRLMETLNIDGPIDADVANRIRRAVVFALEDAFGVPPALADGARVALCGGNAKALAKLLPGQRWQNLRTLSVEQLDDHLAPMLELDVPGRMAAYDVRRDRAEVMAIAALVFVSAGQWLGMDEFVVPGVGVLHGLLEELAWLPRRQRLGHAA